MSHTPDKNRDLGSRKKYGVEQSGTKMESSQTKSQRYFWGTFDTSKVTRVDWNCM